MRIEILKFEGRHELGSGTCGTRPLDVIDIDKVSQMCKSSKGTNARTWEYWILLPGEIYAHQWQQKHGAFMGAEDHIYPVLHSSSPSLLALQPGWSNRPQPNIKKWFRLQTTKAEKNFWNMTLSCRWRNWIPEKLRDFSQGRFFPVRTRSRVWRGSGVKSLWCYRKPFPSTHIVTHNYL